MRNASPSSTRSGVSTIQVSVGQILRLIREREITSINLVAMGLRRERDGQLMVEFQWVNSPANVDKRNIRVNASDGFRYMEHLSRTVGQADVIVDAECGIFRESDLYGVVKRTLDALFLVSADRRQEVVLVLPCGHDDAVEPLLVSRDRTERLLGGFPIATQGMGGGIRATRDDFASFSPAI